LPTPGTITDYREPAGPGVRVDSGVTVGSEVVGLYDPLVAKLVVWDTDRERARRRMLRALGEYRIEGVTTLLGFHRALLEHPCFVAGETCFGLVEEIAAGVGDEPGTAAAAVAPSRVREEVVGVELGGRRFEVTLLRPEPPHAELARRRRERSSDGAHHGAAREAVVSPMQGTVLAVEVRDGDTVREGQVICVVEAMKMENEITAHRPGEVTALSVTAGEPVTTGQVICVVAQEGDRDPAGDDLE
jgi:acetyl-CoA/propionyl-CoA carboxylase biotin carboxyl carrier protein